MTLDYAIGVNQLFNIQPRSTTGNRGDFTWGTAVVAYARVEPCIKKVVTGDGETRMTTHRFLSETEIPLTSRVWLPADSNATPAVTAPSEAKARMPAVSNQCPGEDGTMTDSTSHWETLV